MKYFQYFAYSLFYACAIHSWIKKNMSPCLFFQNLILKFTAFDQFSRNINNNTSPYYRAKTVVIFSQLLSFNLNYCPWPQTFKKMCMFTCYPMLWQDTVWFILAIHRKMEFVFRINHVLKNLILKILKIDF